MKFQKKPVEIEAFEANVAMVASHSPPDSEFYTNRLPEWFRDAVARDEVHVLPDSVKIKTLEGVMTASRGDWIVRGVKGEIYPCKPDIFAASYDPVC